MQQQRWRPYVATWLAIVAFGLLSFRGLLFVPGHVYQNWDHATPPFASELRRLASTSQYAWNPLFELGSSGVFSASNRWFDKAVRDASSPLGGATLAKWQGSVQIALGAGGVLALGAMAGLSWFPAGAAALLYTCNPKMYSLAITGHYQEVGFALAALPWAIFLFARSLTAQTRRSRAAAVVAAGLLGAGICSASFFGIVYFVVLLGFFAFAASWSRKSLRPLLHFAALGLIVVILHAYWLVPAVRSLAAGDEVRGHHSVSSLHDAYAKMYANTSAPLSMAVIGYSAISGMEHEHVYPEYWNNNPSWFVAAYALFALALLGVFSQSRLVGLPLYATISMAFGIVLLAGCHTPLGRFLYESVLARISVIFYLMARTTRWMPLYYAGVSLLVGLGTQFLLTASGRPVAVRLLVLGLLGVYLMPYWSGELTRVKFQSTQTWALMSQPLHPGEEHLARQFEADPLDYRITVWPTIANPKGPLPQPAGNAVESNFGFLGKDSVIGPESGNEPLGRFLLSMLHRPTPRTDHFGRLLGLAAVKYIVYDPSEPYLSYNDFGWMQRSERIPETLFEPEDTYAKYLAAQKDIVPAAEFTAPPFQVYRNEDYLHRVRLLRAARLAAGGLPLLELLADVPDGLLTEEALFFAADLSNSDIHRLAPEGLGAVVAGNSWPELLLPFIDRAAWHPAGQGAQGLEPLRNSWRVDPRLNGSPLDADGVVSRNPGSLVFRLDGPKRYRLFVRCGGLPPGQGQGRVFVDGRLLDLPGLGFRRIGCGWTDLGGAVIDGPAGEVRVELATSGLIVSGLLAVPEATYLEAMGRLSCLVGQNTAFVFHTPEVAGADAAPMTAADASLGRVPLAFGQAVRLPVQCSASIPFPGTYRASVRVIGQAGDTIVVNGGEPFTLRESGANWIPVESVATDAAGNLSLVINGPPADACDLVVLRNGPPSAKAPPAVAVDRVNPAHYRIHSQSDQGGYLVFAESFHPDWRVQTEGETSPPLQAFGFANAFPIRKDARTIELFFLPQALMERWLVLSEAGWIVGCGLLIFCLIPLAAVKRLKSAQQ